MNDTNSASGVHAIEVPREIVNADSVYVVSWAVADGDRVETGAALCDIETSKAVVTVEAEAGGYARPLAAVGDEVPVGGLLGYVTDRPDTPLPVATGGAAASAAASAAPAVAASPQDAVQAAAIATRISAKAQRRIEELGLDVALFAGRGIVREEDVLAVAAARKAEAGTPRDAAGAGREAARHDVKPAADDARGPSELKPMGPIQRRMARVMEQSVAAIAASSLERIVDLAPVRERARVLGAERKIVVTEVDLLVHAVGAACRDFPEFNGYATADHQVRLFEQVNVGVAVDAAGDLYVVVVHDAAAKEAGAVAKELRSLQYLAARKRLSVEQVSGGTVTVTSMLGRGVHRFVPIPYPEQAAIIGLSDTEPDTTRATLVLVFDHRVANGGRAAAFLAAVAEGLQA